MTTAQEIAAYRVLARDGKTEADIARTHGTAVLRVRMLLRLANVAPIFLKAFAVRDDPVAVFIRTDAYAEAGGRLDLDLFSNTDTAAWLDVDLANRLARDKFAAQADTIREAEGLKWARFELDPNFHLEADAFAWVYPEHTPFGDADAARMEKLEILLDDVPDNPKAEAEWREIEERYAPTYPAQARALGGFILALNAEGGLSIERGLIRAEEAPAKIDKSAAAPKFDYVNPNAPRKGTSKDGGANDVNGPQSVPEANKPSTATASCRSAGPRFRRLWLDTQPSLLTSPRLIWRARRPCAARLI